MWYPEHWLAICNPKQWCKLGFWDLLRFLQRCYSLDKHAPLKAVYKKGERVLQKPWVTNGVKTSIKIWDKLYKQIIKQKDAIFKNQKQILYKRYCNKIKRTLIIKSIFKKTGKILKPYGVVSMKPYILRKAVKQFLHHLSQ